VCAGIDKPKTAKPFKSSNDMKTKICSAGTTEALQALINRYYYSTNWVVDKDLRVFNDKLNKELGHVEFKKGRYTYYA